MVTKKKEDIEGLPDAYRKAKKDVRHAVNQQTFHSRKILNANDDYRTPARATQRTTCGSSRGVWMYIHLMRVTGCAIIIMQWCDCFEIPAFV